MSESNKKVSTLLSFNAKYIGILHTLFAGSAFFAALVVGCYLHYEKIVENEFYRYPDEWFPSVSATIGDRYPERSVFQVLIAVTAGPRFLFLFLTYLRLWKPNSKLPTVSLVVGTLRTFTCGGWVYITSTDDHDFHDIFMISYIILTLPWDILVIKLTNDAKLKKLRTIACATFFGTLVPLVYLFIQHKVHRKAGAYSYYAYCEWALIVLDVLFDSFGIIDLGDLKIAVEADNENSLKINYFKKLSFNEDLNPKAKEIQVATNLDKSISKLDKFSKVMAFENLWSYPMLCVHIVNSFIFWSNITGFLAMIWYFPLWHMGISGYEASIVGVLLPVVLVIGPTRSLLSNFPQIPRVAAVVLGVGAYLVPSPEYRLMTSALGSAFSTLALANEIHYLRCVNSAMITPLGEETTKDDLINQEIVYELSSNLHTYYSTTFSIGLLLSAVVKFAFCTNNPIWPIMHKENGGWNNTGLVVGLIAAILTPNYKKFFQALSFAKNTPSLSSASVATTKESFLFASASFGAWIFLLHALMTDSSTIITWVWNGYPVEGPTPVPHGAVSLAFACVGIYLGLAMPNAFYSQLNYFGIVGSGFFLLYAFADEGWLGYLGGLVITLFLYSLAPTIFRNVSRFNPGLVFFVGFLFYIVFMLASVWIVAYAFVPGGPLLRERTDIVFGVPFALLALGMWNLKNIPVYQISDDSFNKIYKHLTNIKKKFRTILIILLVSSGVIAFLRFPFKDPQPHHPESKSFTAGIWTVHFGLDNDLWASEKRMEDLMKDLELDIFGMLETDTQRIVMGNRDLTQQIAQDLGYYTDYGPGPNKHTWGCVLFSKFPILNSTHHLLPSPVGELAPAIHATLNIYDELVDIVVFHSGQEEDVEDRRLQTLYLRDLMGSSPRPLILLSYLVTKPLEGNYNVHVSKESGMHDIDPTDDDRWCEYILFKKIKRVGYARVSRGTITDTEVQVGKFVLAPKDVPEEQLYENKRIVESEVPKDLRFPEMFRGEGVRGHAYHVFNEPRYFQ